MAKGPCRHMAIASLRPRLTNSLNTLGNKLKITGSNHQPGNSPDKRLIGSRAITLGERSSVIRKLGGRAFDRPRTGHYSLLSSLTQNGPSDPHSPAMPLRPSPGSGLLMKPLLGWLIHGFGIARFDPALLSGRLDAHFHPITGVIGFQHNYLVLIIDSTELRILSSGASAHD
jgi:hypothetical protein